MLTVGGLVVGAIKGQLRRAFGKITKLHSKENFSFCLVVGDVFGSGVEAETELGELLAGNIGIPMPTYWTLGDSALPSAIVAKLESSDEVSPNMVYIGRKGTLKTTDGISIVYLGGRLVQNDAQLTQAIGKFDPLFLDSDVRGLHGAHSAHILLTNQWPANVTGLSNIDVPESIDKEDAVQSLANLNLTLKPWYHFSSSPSAMWEREPFKQLEDYGSMEEPKLTRFKSVACVSAPTKEWMTAFSIDTSRPPPAPQSTEAPFLKGGTPPRKRSAPDDGGDGYSRYGNGDRQYRQPKRKRHYDPNDCFMCLNKPEFKAHMVVSIGDESMVTILRGPLPLPDTFPELSFSGHAMIIPHYHAADEAAQGRRPKEEITVEFAEMTKFRKALSKMMGAKSNGRLGTICTEVNRTGIRHFHWQIIAMDAAKIRRGLVEAAFKVLAGKHNYPAFEECPPDELLEQRSDFVRIWMWSPSANPVDRADQEANGHREEAGVTKSLYFPLSPTQKGFYIWYPREVCAGLLQLEHRTNWMSTLLPNDAEEQKLEEQEAEGLKADFADFDFAMQ